MTDDLASITDLAEVPPLVTGSNGLVAVGPDIVAVFDTDTMSIARYVDGVEADRLTVADRPTALSLAGHDVIAAIGDDLVVIGRDQTHRPGVGPYTLQQPGPDGSIVAVDTTLRAFVLSDGGSTRSFDLPSATSEPVNHDGCVFAIVEGPTLVRSCGDDGAETMPIEGATGELRLRVVNGWVWINDLDTGGAWIISADAPLSRIDDWGAALADEEVEESDATVENDGGIEEVRLNPDADDVQMIEADQQDDDDENDPPVARDDTANTRVDRPVVVRVLDNDEDPDGDVLLVAGVELVDTSDAHVWITPSRDAVQVTPRAGFAGRISFRYTIDDGRGGVATALVTVDVSIASEVSNQPPEPVTDVATARAGSAVSLDVLGNDRDPDGDALTLISVGGTDGNDDGRIVFDPSGHVTFTPDAASQQGRIDLTYVVADDFGATAEGRIVVNIRLAGANSPPDARNDSVVTSVGNPARINVLDNDADPDNDPLIVARQPTQTRGPQGHGGDDSISAAVHMTSDGAFSFVPDEPGTYLFDYLASDGQNNDTAQIRVDVSPAETNQPPVAIRDDVSIPMGGTRLVYVLDNDGDPNGDVVDIVEWSGAPGLTIEPVPGIGFRVTVETNAAPRVTFRYAISDGIAEPAATVVVVSVADVAVSNQPPIVRPDMIELRPGRSTVIPVLLNDFDPEGGSLSVIRLPPSDENVTYELGPDSQSIVITVAPTATTGFRFGYDVTDIDGATAASIVDVRIIDPTEPNRPPTARSDIGRTVEDGRSPSVCSSTTATPTAIRSRSRASRRSRRAALPSSTVRPSSTPPPTGSPAPTASPT
ncbi:MAG: Ig-like domain-containing protein [Acidimicrobiales bacterium]